MRCHAVSNRRYSPRRVLLKMGQALSPRNIVGCLLKNGLQRGTRVSQEPPRYALASVPSG